jgi:hypothetical protein
MLGEDKETIRKIEPLVAALVSVLVTLVACVLALNLLPAYSAPYALFRYGDELVGIDLLGGLAPLLACLPLFFLLASDPQIPGARFHVSKLFSASLLLACILPVLLFTLLQESSGSLTLGPLGGAVAILSGAVLGAAYASLRGSEVSILRGGSECFVVCAVGIFVSDMIRTLTGLVGAPGEAVIWGGGGSHDLVLWFGIYMTLSYVVFRLSLPALDRFLVGSKRAGPHTFEDDRSQHIGPPA